MNNSISNALVNKVAKSAEVTGSGIRQDAINQFVAADPQQRIDRGSRSVASGFNAAADELNKATDAIESALARVTFAEKKAVTEAKVAVSRAKDIANQMSDQLARVSKILGGDFTARLDQLERLVDALEKLNRLDSDGKLEKLLNALK